MLTKSYQLTLATVIVVSLLLIVSLSVLLVSNGPRVRLVDFDRDPAITALTKDSTMSISFDRPLEPNDYTEQISFTPEVDFSARTAGQTITLILADNLSPETTYTLSVGPEIFDQSGKPMDATFTREITTEAARFAYLERNYGQTYDETTGREFDALDHINIGQPGSEPERLFSHPEIVMFAANDTYAVVIAREEDRDQLITVNLATGGTRQEELLLGGRLSNLSMSPRGTIALFSVVPDFDSVTREYYDRFANRVESLNLDTGEVITLSNEANDYLRANSVRLAIDGQVALIQDQAQAFYAISPFNDYDPVLIGKHTDTFGFNDATSEIVFRDNTEFSRYQIASGNISTLELNLPGRTQTIVAREQGIYVSTLQSQAARQLHEVSLLDDWDDSEAHLLWTNNGDRDLILRDLSVSHDGSLLALKLHTDGCRFDTVSSNSECQDVRTFIYDTDTSSVVAEFSGFDLVWLP